MRRVPLSSSSDVGHNIEAVLQATLLTRDSSTGGRELHAMAHAGNHSSIAHSDLTLQIMN